MESLHRYDLSQLNSSSLANQTGWTYHIVTYLITHSFTLLKLEIIQYEPSRSQYNESINYYIIVFGIIPLSFVLYLTAKIYFTCIRNSYYNENSEIAVIDIESK